MEVSWVKSGKKDNEIAREEWKSEKVLTKNEREKRMIKLHESI
jgi:hypothetical protein